MLQLETIVCNLIEEQCYIIWDDSSKNDCWIIDCGAPKEEELQYIFDFIEKKSLKPVRHLLTHGHFDHLWGSEGLRKRYQILPTLLQEEESTYKNSNILMHALLRTKKDFILPEIGEFLTDGQKLQLGNLTFEVIATPGHTPGGCCYYCKEAKALFSGDTMFYGSYGRTDFPGGNILQLTESLKKLLKLPDDTVVYPGHGPSTTIIGERSHYNFAD